MDIHDLLARGRKIWGDDRLRVSQIVTCLSIVVGDIARHARGSSKDAVRGEDDLKKELGNIIFSTIRWCDDLGFDPAECIERAERAQQDFVKHQKMQG